MSLRAIENLSLFLSLAPEEFSLAQSRPLVALRGKDICPVPTAALRLTTLGQKQTDGQTNQQ